MHKHPFPMNEQSGAEGHRERNVKFHADSSSKERREEKLRKYFNLKEVKEKLHKRKEL